MYSNLKLITIIKRKPYKFNYEETFYYLNIASYKYVTGIKIQCEQNVVICRQK